MKIDEELSYSQNKTKITIYRVIGRKISESRKSSRRKLEGISKKLNINIDILKKIESGEIETIEKEIPVTGFNLTNSSLTILQVKNPKIYINKSQQ